MQTVTSAKPIVLGLFTIYEANIKRLRKLFFDHIEDHYGEKVSFKVQKILLKRIDSASTPLQGELWPWMLQRSFNIEPDDNNLTRLIKQWYALYLAIVMIDNAIDERNHKIDFEVLLPLLTEAGPLMGETSLMRMSVIGQLNDMRQAPDPRKNAFVGSLVKKIASISEPQYRDERFELFLCGTDMMSVLQLLDDLSDIHIDFKRRHKTSIITKKIVNSLHFDLEDIFADEKTDYRENVRKTLWNGSNQADRLKVLFGERHRNGVEVLEETECFQSLSHGLNSLAHYMEVMVPKGRLSEKISEVSCST